MTGFGYYYENAAKGKKKGNFVYKRVKEESVVEANKKKSKKVGG